jgi:hypothetical protein
MLIDVRKPIVQVKLHKTVGRTTLNGSAPVSARYAGQSREVDLTPYLGDGSAVRVMKSVHEPAGAFSVSLPDQIDPEVLDTLYAVIEPMDMIEIRISAPGFEILQDAGGWPPVMMRGFVSGVQRMEGMGADGKPMRQVVISGQDYGKLLQINQIFFLPNGPDTANLMTELPFFTKFGDFHNNYEAGPFTQALFDRVINPYVAAMNFQTMSPLLLFETDIQVSGSTVSPFGTGAWDGGTLYELIRAYGDIGPWNEFFVEDRFDAPYAVYRPNPFMDAVTHEFIMPGPTLAKVGVTDIDRSDVISMTSARSDANVANYFWVPSHRFLLNYDSDAKSLAFQSVQTEETAAFYVQDYGNVDPVLYGSRKMEEQTNQGGLGETNNGNGTKNDPARLDNWSSAMDWMNLRRRQLYEQNRDNVIFETGSMRLKGNEKIRAGTYVRLTHGNMRSYYYAVSVTHDFTPFGNYFTEVQFERGTGFIDRVQRAAGQDSPYWDEMVTQP